MPSDLIALTAPGWLWSELLEGDLSHSAIFDNTKIKRFVPEFGARSRSRSARNDSSSGATVTPNTRRAISEVDAIYDRIARAYEQARSIFEAAAPTG